MVVMAVIGCCCCLVGGCFGAELRRLLYNGQDDSFHFLPTVRPNSNRWVFAWNQLFKESDRPHEGLTTSEPDGSGSRVPWTEVGGSELPINMKTEDNLFGRSSVTAPPPPATTTLFAALTISPSTLESPNNTLDARHRLNRLTTVVSGFDRTTPSPEVFNATVESHSIQVVLPLDETSTGHLSSTYYRPTTVGPPKRLQISQLPTNWSTVITEDKQLSNRNNYTTEATRKELQVQDFVTSIVTTNHDEPRFPANRSSTEAVPPRLNVTATTSQVFNVSKPTEATSFTNETTTMRPLVTTIQVQSIQNKSSNHNESTTRPPNPKQPIRKQPTGPPRKAATSKGINLQSSTPSELLSQFDWVNQVHHITTPQPYDAKRDCGIRTLKREGRVVGGRDSHLGEFPWSVLIRETTLLGFFVKTKCGGVLIDLKWVLTAAHCQPGMFGSLVVVVGEYDLQGKSNRLKPMIKKVKRMIIHRDYNPSNFDNDIALLELESPYKVQPHVVPICLPEKGEEFIGQPAMVAGWGKLSFGGPVPSVLQVAKLPVIGNKQCQDMYHDSGHMKIISDSFLCAGYANGGQDSCEGDSGGPLQVQRADGKWVLVGTVSHGIKCAEPNLPGIYIRTAAYLPWIRAVTYHQDTNKRYGHRRQFHIH